MTAIIFGLLTALSFGFATVASSRSVLVARPYVVVAWVMLIGLIVAVPIAAISGWPTGLSVTKWGLLAFIGVANVGGLVLTYAALKVGKVAIVAPIVAAEGAIAAIFSFFLGESLSALAILALALIAAGVIASSVQRGDEQQLSGSPWRPIGLAVGATVLFGTSLFTTGFLAGDVPSGFLLLPPRVAGVLVLTIPFALMRQLSVPRRIAPLLIIAGLGEVFGFVFFIVAAQESIAIASVLMSQYALIAALIGVLLFKERLSVPQYFGVGALLVGVTLLAISVG